MSYMKRTLIVRIACICFWFTHCNGFSRRATWSSAQFCFAHRATTKRLSSVRNELAVVSVLSALCLAPVNAMDTSLDLSGIGIHPIRSVHTSLVMSGADKVEELRRLKKGSSQVRFLLNNWEQKTRYCNFGEFNNELLAPENKEALMKEAAAGGLLDYDKSATMTVKCKRDPMIVRAYAGLMDENPTLVNAVKLMQSEAALDRVLEADVVDVDLYIAAVDSYSKALSEVDLLSYSARTDYSSTETQTLEETKRTYEQAEQGVGQKSYLVQCRDSMKALSNSLDTVVKALAL